MRRSYSASRHSDGNSLCCVPYISTNARATASRATNACLSVIGSNRRRRTISNPSSGLAGRQLDSTRPMAFFKRDNALWPQSPPISLSEAGMLTTNNVSFAVLADSLRVWAKVNCVSNDPAGRSLPSCNCRAYATHSSIRIKHGENRLNRSLSRSPGLVAFSSSSRTIS